MVGKDGIKALTRDTKALMKQQVELANAMKGMQPLIGQAKEMMNPWVNLVTLTKWPVTWELTKVILINHLNINKDKSYGYLYFATVW